jgi:hypothetical protein
MPPELKLMFALGGSAFMFHLRNTMFKSALPGMMAGMSGRAQNDTPQGGGGGSGGGGIGGLMGGLMSGGIGSMLGGLMGGSSQQQQMPNPFSGKGPTKVDEILNEMNINEGDDRIETLSTLSGSDNSEIPDDQSSRVFTTKKNAKRTLDI